MGSEMCIRDRAKKYDHDKAPAFVNGLLNSVAVKEGLKETEPAK